MITLKNITELSREFGTDEYVKAGGGNTSCKDKTTIWIKPSGTILSGMTEGTFVALDRAKVDPLFYIDPSIVPADREKHVRRIMVDSLKPGYSGRPSIEAPLHNILNAVYVVHTHPALVNGMTCGRNGREKCAELFPEALWTEYYNPGFSLSLGLKEMLDGYRKKFEKEPELIFLKNHGVFVSSDTPDGIRNIYRNMMDILREYYKAAGVETEGPRNASAKTGAEIKIKEIMGKVGRFTKTNIPFDVCYGPLSPDHIVYSKALPYRGKLSKEGVDSFKNANGYYPRVFDAGDAVVTIGSTQKQADNAMLFALDASFVCSLSAAFGGAEFMAKEAAEFIENWEAESYRSKVAEKQ